MSEFWGRIKPQLLLAITTTYQFTRRRNINLIICAIVVLISIYLTSLALFNRKIFDPLENNNDKLNKSTPSNQVINHSFSAMSAVILWIAAVVAGYLMHLIKLPALLGVLICGILFRNIGVLADHMFIDYELNAFLRKIAFTVILIRGGIGLDPEALKKTWSVIFRLGIISPIAEALVITGLALLIFGMDVKMSFVFGMSLAATSPAVTIPTMLGLNKRGYGASSGVPTVLLAAAAIDNMICLTFANIFLALIFSSAPIATEIGLIISQVIVGIVIGIVSGLFLWYFPHIKSRQLHFGRALILECFAMTFIFGGGAVNWYSSGVIATIICSIVAAIKWKSDNKEKSKKESESFALIWNLIGMQVMFVLIGYEFSLFDLQLVVVLKGLAILVTAVIVRIVVVFSLAFGGGFTRLEQIFMSISFFPKATVQAALVPQILEECLGTPFEPEAQIIMQICVIAILLTAPIGQFILQLFGPYALRGKNPHEVHSNSNSDEKSKKENGSVVQLQVNAVTNDVKGQKV